MGRGTKIAARRKLAQIEGNAPLRPAEWLLDQYAAELPAGYDLKLSWSAVHFELTLTGPDGLHEEERVDLSPEDAERSSVFRRLAATAKMHDRVRRASETATFVG